MPKRPLLGLTEKITLIGPEAEKTVIARIDSGATNSSIDSSLAKKLKLGPIVKKKLVKSARGSTIRPFIIVKIKLGQKSIENEFNLARRGHMKYPVLIGQNILKEGKFLIDPLKK